MRVFRNLVLQVVILAFALGAQAQVVRTWVSGVGDDVNPCSRTAPCKTWAGAISKTAAGGEINALDSGGFGTVTITKSIIIDGNAQHASALNSGGINGFNINDSATATPNTIKVVLRNLAIDGASATILGLNGIRFTSGKDLTVENVYIANQSNRGIDIQRAANAPLSTVNIVNTTIQTCGSAAIGVNAVASTGAVRLAIHNSRLMNCASGLFAGQSSEISMSNTLISNNSVAGVDASSNSVVNVDNSTIMNNATAVQTSSTAVIRLSRDLIVQNSVRAFGVSGGTIQSYLDNYLSGNGVSNIGVLTNISSSKQ
jgi:hypothetical protein